MLACVFDAINSIEEDQKALKKQAWVPFNSATTTYPLWMRRYHRLAKFQYHNISHLDPDTFSANLTGPRPASHASLPGSRIKGEMGA
jgi:hypothetical protein